jgi:predicted lipoprotein with Yx(FWY)xxD motif
MRSIVIATAGAFALSIAAAGANDQPRELRTPPAVPAPRPADPRPNAPRASAVVDVARTPYGPTLVDRRGFALYRFTHDHSSSSSCYGACAVVWPPYVVAHGRLIAGSGAATGLLGTARRRDGGLQVTYAGHPLYYYVGDRRPREALCQGVAEFGGTWYVVAGDGHAVR